MSDFADQIEALRLRMEAKHVETLAKMEALRSEYKTDHAELSGVVQGLQGSVRGLQESVRVLQEAVQSLSGNVESLSGTVERQGLRHGARLEGLETVLEEQVKNTNTELSMLFGLVTNALQENARRESNRDDDVQSCLNKINGLELRVKDLEARRPPAA